MIQSQLNFGHGSVGIVKKYSINMKLRTFLVITYFLTAQFCFANGMYRFGYESRKEEFSYREEILDRVAIAPSYHQVEIMPLNEYRSQNGLYALRWNQDLYDSAMQRAMNIHLGIEEFSHQGWIKHIETYYTDRTFIGENLARDFDDPAEVLTAWIESTTHREVLLNTSACEYGLARYYTTFVLHIGCK